MILQASARLKSGKSMFWQINSTELDENLEIAVSMAREMVIAEVKSETKSAPVAVLVGIQGGKR